jgi:hypothetical protein
MTGQQLGSETAAMERIHHDRVELAARTAEVVEPIHNAAFDLVWQAKIAAGKNECLRFTSTATTPQPARDNMVASEPPPHPIIRTERARFCNSRPKMAWI